MKVRVGGCDYIVLRIYDNDRVQVFKNVMDRIDRGERRVEKLRVGVCDCIVLRIYDNDRVQVFKNVVDRIGRIDRGQYLSVVKRKGRRQHLT